MDVHPPKYGIIGFDPWPNGDIIWQEIDAATPGELGCGCPVNLGLALWPLLIQYIQLGPTEGSSHADFGPVPPETREIRSPNDGLWLGTRFSFWQDHQIVGFWLTFRPVFPHLFHHSTLPVGGLEHFLLFHLLGRIIPTDELILFRGVGIPPTRCRYTPTDHHIAKYHFPSLFQESIWPPLTSASVPTARVPRCPSLRRGAPRTGWVG